MHPNDNDEEFPVEGGPQGPAGNRPASNAHLSSSLGATDSEFGASEQADDFLGLDGEVEALAQEFAQTVGEEELPTTDEGDLALSSGWLLEVPTEQAAVPPTGGITPAAGGVVPDGGAAVPEGTIDSYADAPLDGDATPDGLGPVEGEFDDYDDYDEEYDDEYEGEYDEEFVTSRGSSPLARIGLLGALAAVLGASALFFLRGDSGSEADPVDVAQVTPTPRSTPDVGPTPTAGGGADTSAGSGEVLETQDLLDGLLVGGAASDGEGSGELLGAGDGAPTLDPVAVPTLDPVSSSTAPDAGPITTPRPLAGDPSSVEDESVMARIERATETGDVQGFMTFETRTSGLIWTGTEVPYEAIAREGRLLTPAVGVVRAVMKSGELFEGNLYGVGGNRVWLEVGPGRVGLDGGRIEKIERLIERTKNPHMAEAGLGQRVRIRTAGGTLYGRVKTRDGDRVVIMTDKGARITLENPVIEPIGRVSGLVLKP